MAPAEAAEAEAQEAFQKVREAVRRGDELQAVLQLDLWGEDGRPARPLERGELQRLLEDAARTGYQPNTLKAIAAKLESAGVALDWSAGQDCSGNLGRYALDGALDVAIGENRDERVALLLLDLGLASGKGSTEQLNANPLLRSAAAQGLPRVAERLLARCGAELDAPDPRFGSVALDRAVDAGNEALALRLLELGADPDAGRGVSSLMQRAGPKLRARLLLSRRRGGKREAEQAREATEPFEDFRRRLRRLDEASALVALDARLAAEPPSLRPVELSLLLEDAALPGKRRRLLRRLVDELREAGVNIGWGEDSAVDSTQGFLGQRPLDAALRAAVEENSDERVALFLLEEGLEDSGGDASRLNANPLLRTAAAKCLPSVLRALVAEGGAEPDAPDPRFGGTALDRAVESGCWSGARALLALGADPNAGRGLSYLLDRVGPELAGELQRAAASKGG